MIDEKGGAYFIGWLCEECLNISGKPPLVFGDKDEGRELFGCTHEQKKVRVYDDGSRYEIAQDGDPDE